MAKTKKITTPPVTEKGSDVFTVIENAKKNLDGLRKGLERDDTGKAAIISLIANTKSGEVDVTIFGDTAHIIQLLTSVMKHDEEFKVMVLTALIELM